MGRLKQNEIKVDSNVKPKHIKDRKPFELVPGEKYYVSFGMNRAVPCKLIEIIMENETKFVSVLIEHRDQSSTHSLYADEIGRTPEEAVINEVTM